MTLIILIILITILFSFFGNSDNQGYYNGIKWNATYDDVKNQIEGAFVPDEDARSISTSDDDFENLEDIAALVTYYFSNGGLHKVTVALVNSDTSTYTDDALFHKVVSIYDNKYGKHEKDGLTYSWTTKKSIITLTYDVASVTNIIFQDLNTTKDK